MYFILILSMFIWSIKNFDTYPIAFFVTIPLLFIACEIRNLRIKTKKKEDKNDGKNGATE